MSIIVAGLLLGFAGGFASAGCGVALFMWRRRRRARAVTMALGPSE
ncbi:hypothetical protein [Gluconacetobacter entanii]|nr:hypothetical protein [Gluconacetobacter entanii]